MPLNRIFLAIVLLFSLNAISAVAFMLLVDHPVYDDQYNIYDVHTYAIKGVSVATIRSNRNPPGPTSFIWMAMGVRLLHTNELRAARVAVLLSWMLLVAGTIVGAQISNYEELWYGALLVTLIFPHSVEAAALVLTEGPALLFATLGTLAWIEFVSMTDPGPLAQAFGIAGGFSMGLSVTCRQYYLALLPAAFVLVIYRWRGLDVNNRLKWRASVTVSLAAAVLPVFLMIIVWKGFSSPGISSGASYANWQARMGLSLSRPVIAALYSAIYFLPLSFPAMLHVRSAQRRWAFPVSIIGGITAGLSDSLFLQPGPLHSFVNAISRMGISQSIALGLIATVTIYNIIAVCLLLWDKRTAWLSSPLVLFAVLTVVLFVIEQFGVGGNIPLYDRYLLQFAPFVGIISFYVLPRMTYARVIVLAAMSLLSHYMLWRFAFIAPTL